LGDGGETVSSREHGEGCGGNGTSVFHLGEHGQSESEGEKGERECGGGGVHSTFIFAPGLATWGVGRTRAPRGRRALPERHDAGRLSD
jgi:hypothetical protein